MDESDLLKTINDESRIPYMKGMINMKKAVGALVCISIITSLVVGSLAADQEKHEPDVFVDNSKIIFEDQNAVIVDDVTLVPARGVFSVMGCNVDWDEETRTVKVTSSTGVRFAVITIDSDVMKIYTYKDIMNRTSVEYKLEVPAQIINDRTMIPLRAVSEAFDCDVNWNEDDYAVEITTGAPIYLEGYEPPAEVENNEKPTVSISTDNDKELNACDEFNVYIDVKNYPEGKYLSGLSAALLFDKEKFEYVPNSGTAINDADEAYDADIQDVNSEYITGLKLIFVTIDAQKARSREGHAYKVTLKSKNGEAGAIALTNDYYPIIGYETYAMFGDEETDTVYNGKSVVIDKTQMLIGE